MMNDEKSAAGLSASNAWLGHCPYCWQKIKIADAVKTFLETCGGPVKARTDCCGSLVRVEQVATYRCEGVGQNGKDYWGN